MCAQASERVSERVSVKRVSVGCVNECICACAYACAWVRSCAMRMRIRRVVRVRNVGHYFGNLLLA